MSFRKETPWRFVVTSATGDERAVIEQVGTLWTACVYKGRITSSFVGRWVGDTAVEAVQATGRSFNPDTMTALDAAAKEAP